jgi:hypothetical protein
MNPTPITLPAIIVLVGLLVLVLSIRRFRKVGRLPHKKWRRVTERIVLSLVILVTAVVTLTTAYNTIAARYYESTFQAPGKLYNVGGYRMHLYCTGEGSPTLVLEGVDGQCAGVGRSAARVVENNQGVLLRPRGIRLE